MDALMAQFSFLADQALHDDNFDPSKFDDLLALFEQEATAAWSVVEAEHQQAAAGALNPETTMQEAESYLNSIMEAFPQYSDASLTSAVEVPGFSAATINKVFPS